MSKKIGIELTDEELEMLHSYYELKKEDFDSFDDFFSDFERFINLKLKKFILDCELAEVDRQIKELKSQENIPI